jgi:hypothetical protein
MSRWTRTAWLVLLPALLVSVALLGCSGDKKKGGGDGKKEKDDKGGGGDDEMKPVPVGSGTITGTVTLKEGVKLPIEELNAGLKKKIDENVKYRDACKEAYEQTTWLVDKNRNVQNVVVWIMPEKENQFFDAKELAMKKQGFDDVVVLDQPHCHFEPRIVVLFPAYIEPTKPKTDEGEVNYVPTTQKFYAVNPAEIQHNTKLIMPTPAAGKNVSQVVDKSTKAKPEKGLNLTEKSGLRPYDITKGPIQIACDIHNWMAGRAWALPHPLADVTNPKGEFKIANVPDSGKVRIFVWHEGAGFINKDGDAGEVIDLKSKDTKKDFTISKLK